MSTRFTLRGPAWLHDRGAFLATYQATLGSLLTSLAGDLKGAAQSAYAGTRFAQTFTYRTALQPYAELRLYQSDPIFPYVEYPTRAHDIYPKTPTGMLHWTNASGAHFARHVRHPGTKGRNAIAPIMQQYEARFRAILIQAVREGATRG